jgi:hypothetical protein
MTGHGGGSRSGARARKPIRPVAPQGREPGKEKPLVAVGQILLGLSLSCLIAMVIGVALIGVVAGIAYLLK